ncbi:hypothetical protein BDN70DRAFT_925891 [Pholiota conissans]|uniref:Uncharacterized protein n=1 Tax=Pholiota conissans TaxID=109636 RepID=A0A9P6CSD4_9AGAR|nr:hypothetical protein BDN70DRAFT_925891 [Pholiota conissans]
MSLGGFLKAFLSGQGLIQLYFASRLISLSAAVTVKIVSVQEANSTILQSFTNQTLATNDNILIDIDSDPHGFNDSTLYLVPALEINFTPRVIQNIFATKKGIVVHQPPYLIPQCPPGNYTLELHDATQSISPIIATSHGIQINSKINTTLITQSPDSPTHTVSTTAETSSATRESPASQTAQKHNLFLVEILASISALLGILLLTVLTLCYLRRRRRSQNIDRPDKIVHPFNASPSTSVASPSGEKRDTSSSSVTLPTGVPEQQNQVEAIAQLHNRLRRVEESHNRTSVIEISRVAGTVELDPPPEYPESVSRS